MADKEQNLFMAKLAEQAERYEGKRSVLYAMGGLFEVVRIFDCNRANSVTVGKQFF